MKMRDLIERQAAINALGSRPGVSHISDYYGLGARNQYDKDRLALETLPPAEPKVEDVVDLDFNVKELKKAIDHVVELLTSAQPEVIPHRNYKYLSDYWCECGWHLGKRGDVKYCPDCGRKVKWDGWLNQPTGGD